MLTNGLKIAIATTAVAAAVSVCGTVAHVGAPARSTASVTAQGGSATPSASPNSNDPWD